MSRSRIRPRSGILRRTTGIPIWRTICSAGSRTLLAFCLLAPTSEARAQPPQPPQPPQETFEAYEVESGDPWYHVGVPALVDWDGSIELGINGSEGNAQAFNIQAGGSLKRETDTSMWETDFKYAKNQANSIETQHFGMFNLRHEHKFESPWTLFTRFGLRYDEFQAYDVRAFMNAGVGYRFIDGEHTKLKGRVGPGVSREFGGPSDDWVPEATFGMDFEHQLTERQKFTATMDYFPDIRDFKDYRLMTDVGWELLIDKAANLSLKLSLIDWYDSTPEGREPNDLNYALLLLWKL